MSQAQFKQQLLEMIQEIESDDEMDDQLKEKMKDLITATAVDPTPANLDALSEVCEQMSKSNKYRAAMTTLQNIKEDSAIELDDTSNAPVEAN